jgi:C-terminal processing protease CtpA/Prc
MKRRPLQLLAVGIAFVAAAVFLTNRSDEDPATEQSDMAAADERVPEKVPVVMQETTVPDPPAPAAEAGMPTIVKRNKPAQRPPPANRPTGKPTEAQQRAAMLQMWKRAELRFNQQQDQLEGVADPARREQLISQMARNIRMDTLATIEWAMGLEDPAERRLALEAINQHALSGIGARINVDNTGFPRIQETTALSAVASTGMVEPGDYIVGMVNAAGQMIDFENMPIQQIIQHLRGEPGSELLLMMERGPDGYPFDVPVQRSLLVIQPPF